MLRGDIEQGTGFGPGRQLSDPSRIPADVPAADPEVERLGEDGPQLDECRLGMSFGTGLEKSLHVLDSHGAYPERSAASATRLIPDQSADHSRRLRG